MHTLSARLHPRSVACLWLLSIITIRNIYIPQIGTADSQVQEAHAMSAEAGPLGHRRVGRRAKPLPPQVRTLTGLDCLAWTWMEKKTRRPSLEP